MVMWGGIALLILVICYFVFSKSEAEIKGEEGEKIVGKYLKKLNQKNYEVFHDLQFSINGKISQIDHLVISNYGVFVIETKNYKGMIKGREHDANWTQIIGKYKNPFYSPIRQNRGHIYALKHVLRGFRLEEFESIIVFTNRGTLNVKSVTPVIYPKRLVKQIKKNREVIISDDLKQCLIRRIKEENLSKRKRIQLKKAS